MVVKKSIIHSISSQKRLKNICSIIIIKGFKKKGVPFVHYMTVSILFRLVYKCVSKLLVESTYINLD